MNKSINEDDLEQEQEVEVEERESEKPRNVRKILYSDKSESSIDDMMEDTPSNYNIPNGRLEGKSLGLKAILLHARKQGLSLNSTQAKHNDSMKNSIANNNLL